MKAEIPFVLIYDCRSNKIRNKLSRILKDYGLRMSQYSVAGGMLSSRRRYEMEDEIGALLKDVPLNEAYVCIVPLSQYSLDRLTMIGDNLSLFQSPLPIVLMKEDFIRKGDFREETR